jgi:hypothetical protein
MIRPDLATAYLNYSLDKLRNPEKLAPDHPSRRFKWQNPSPLNPIAHPVPACQVASISPPAKTRTAGPEKEHDGAGMGKLYNNGRRETNVC